MRRKTNQDLSLPAGGYDIDGLDRKILGALVQDATVSYASLGSRVGLSAPATHERVKRLKASGAIRAISADIDPSAVGKSVLAFVHVDTAGWGGTPELLRVQDYPEVEEIHSVAGDTSMLLKIRTEDSKGLEFLLAKLHSIAGVKATRSYVVLSTYLERSVQI